MVLLRIARAFIPVATFWIGKLIIDGVIAARASNASLDKLWRYIIMELIIVAAGGDSFPLAATQLTAPGAELRQRAMRTPPPPPPHRRHCTLPVCEHC